MTFRGLVLQARREEHAAAIERVHRTAGTTPVSGAAQRERLYHEAVERQARLERVALERQQQMREAELDGVTFTPQLSERASQKAADGRPARERLMAWEHQRQAKLAEKVAASPTSTAPKSPRAPKSPAQLSADSF